MLLAFIAHIESHVAEHAPSIWEEYISILTDPPHLMLEITVHIFMDVVIGMLAWPFIKKRIHRHDRDVHGIERDHKH